MPTRTRDIFTTIHTEGAILPADLLQLHRVGCGVDLDKLTVDVAGAARSRAHQAE